MPEPKWIVPHIAATGGAADFPTMPNKYLRALQTTNPRKAETLARILVLVEQELIPNADRDDHAFWTAAVAIERQIQCMRDEGL